MRTHKVHLTIKLIINIEDNLDLDDVINDLDYNFDVAEGEENAEVVYTEIVGCCEIAEPLTDTHPL